MIVPFIMTMLTIKDRPYLWAFYKSVDFVKKNGGALIAQEEYFIDPKVLAQEGRAEACDKTWNERNELNYDLPKKEDFDLFPKYMIPKSFEEKLIEEAGSINDAQMRLLSDIIEELEEMILGYIDDIEEKSNEKIEAFITLCHNPSLSAAAEKRGIPVVHFEIGTFREPTYLKTAYFDFSCLYGDASTERRYKKFLQELEKESVPILSNREILALMLKRDYLYYLNHLDDKPRYEMGVALGYAVWPLYQRNTLCDDGELLYRASKMYSIDKLLVRKHPGDPVGATYPCFDYCRDESLNTLDFILKCQRVASVGSNVCFEAMLFGRTSYVLTDCPYTYQTKRAVEDTALQECDLFYLNFYIFAYLIPFKYLWDEDYIKWRLTNPAEIEIYKKNLEFYFAQKDFSLDLLNLKMDERFAEMMKQQDYDLKADYAKVPLKEKRKFTVSDYQKQIRRLKSLLEEKKS